MEDIFTIAIVSGAFMAFTCMAIAFIAEMMR